MEPHRVATRGLRSGRRTLRRHPRRRGAAGLVLAAAWLGVAVPASGQQARSQVEPEILDQVRAIMEDPRVQEAFRYLEAEDEATMADLLELTGIPAPPFMEEVRGRRFQERLEEIGVDTTWVDEVGNVIGVRRGAGEGTLVFSGHLDTVFPEGTDVSVRMSGDTLYAPGIADDTRGLATVLAVLRALNAAGIETRQDVWFVGTVGEEGLGDLRGVKRLFADHGDVIDGFVSVDGLGRHSVTNAGLGSYRYRITFQGPGGHSWGAFGLANPMHALGRAIGHFDEAALAYTDAAQARTSYNVGRMGGGTSVNSIPFEAWIEVDMRSESPANLDDMARLFLAAMERGLEEENAQRKSGEPLTLQVEKIGDRPSGEIPPEHPYVQRALAATELTGGLATLRRGSTDSNTPIAMGIPSVTIGGGGAGGGAHSLDEFYVNHEGPRGIQRALLLLLAQAGLAQLSE